MEENGQRQVTSVEKCDKSRVSIRNWKTDRKYIHCWTREGQGVRRGGGVSLQWGWVRAELQVLILYMEIV